MYNIKNPEIWFAQTIEERNAADVPRLKLLPGQLVEGEPGDITLWVQSDTKPRMDNPVVTIFVVRTIVKREVPISKTKYYSTDKGPLIVLDTVEEYKRDYEEYLKQR